MVLGSTEAFTGPSLAIFASPGVFSRLRAAATSAKFASHKRGGHGKMQRGLEIGSDGTRPIVSKVRLRDTSLELCWKFFFICLATNHCEK